MEITINEELKTIKVKGGVNLLELFNYLQQHGMNLKDYSLVGTEYFSCPDTTPAIFVPCEPYNPFGYPTITYGI